MSMNSPLRILDVPEPDGSPPINQWAILSQHEALVLSNVDDDSLESWSSHKSDAVLMPWPIALRCAQRFVSDGKAVVLVRGNAESWQWLMLVTEWPLGVALAE
jgi:hypothetical protein